MEIGFDGTQDLMALGQKCLGAFLVEKVQVIYYNGIMYSIKTSKFEKNMLYIYVG